MNLQKKCCFIDAYNATASSVGLENRTDFNTQYSDMVVESRNCYLSNIVINGCEDICYSYNVKDNSQDIFSSAMIWNSSKNTYMSM